METAQRSSPQSINRAECAPRRWSRCVGRAARARASGCARGIIINSVQDNHRRARAPALIRVFLELPPNTRFFDFSYSLCLQTPRQAKERVLPLKCGSFCEKCYEFLVMYCNYEYPGKIKKIEPDVRSPCTLSCTLPHVLLSSGRWCATCARFRRHST